MAETVLRYPEDVAKFNKWLRFDVRKGRHVGRGQIVDGQIKDSVVMAAALYLPSSALRSQMTVEYDTTEFSGMMMELAAQAATQLASMKTGQSIMDQAGAVRDSLMAALYNTVGDATAGDALEWGKKAAQKAAVEAFGTQIEALTGQKVNPRTDIIFSSQQYRAWTFEYILIPRTLKEAQSIEKIINMFRFYMLPSYQNSDSKLGPKASYMMGYPYEWTIGIYGSGRDTEGGDSYGPVQTITNEAGQMFPPPPGSNSFKHANKIGRSVLRSLSVDQAAGGKVAFVGESGQKELYPLVTSMTLEFQEVILLGRDQRELVDAPESDYPDPRG